MSHITEKPYLHTHTHTPPDSHPHTLIDHTWQFVASVAEMPVCGLDVCDQATAAAKHSLDAKLTRIICDRHHGNHESRLHTNTTMPLVTV